MMRYEVSFAHLGEGCEDGTLDHSLITHMYKKRLNQKVGNDCKQNTKEGKKEMKPQNK